MFGAILGSQQGSSGWPTDTTNGRGILQGFSKFRHLVSHEKLQASAQVS